MTIHPGFPAGGPEAALDHATLLAALPALSRARVLVVGDAMLDRYLYGFVQRISPEAPIPIVAVEREVTMPGRRRQRDAQPHRPRRRRRLRLCGG